MESRVMGNCHARFGAGENLEERICSRGLHIPPKGLPIAILYNGRGGAGIQTAGAVQQEPVRGAQSPDRAVGGGVLAALPGGEPARRHEKGL